MSTLEPASRQLAAFTRTDCRALVWSQQVLLVIWAVAAAHAAYQLQAAGFALGQWQSPLVFFRTSGLQTLATAALILRVRPVQSTSWRPFRHLPRITLQLFKHSLHNISPERWPGTLACQHSKW